MYGAGVLRPGVWGGCMEARCEGQVRGGQVCGGGVLRPGMWGGCMESRSAGLQRVHCPFNLGPRLLGAVCLWSGDAGRSSKDQSSARKP